MARNEAGLHKALDLIPELRQEFWRSVKVPGTGATVQPVAREGQPHQPTSSNSGS